MESKQRQRRTRNLGAVYQRGSDGLWVGTVTLPSGLHEKRRKKVFYGKTREVAQAKLDEWKAENRPDAPQPDAPLPTSMDRKHSLTAARERGTHTASQWEAKRLSSAGVCYYCRRNVGPSGGWPDHIVPIGRGGSDGIDDIVLSCPAV